jgi:hypothetical protein
MGKYCQVYAL